MVPVLNHIGTDVACVGNHDLDFGVPKFSELAAECSFPWLLANVLDPALGEGVPLGNAKPTLMLTGSNGIKIGVIGLVEREWLDTINTLPPNLIYKSASATALEWAERLRKEGADMVIALTHQREPNDIKIAQKLPPGTVDLILGGHDHFYGHSIINGTHLLRSGTDFKQLSYVEAWRCTDVKGWDFTIRRREIMRSYPEDSQAASLVSKLSGKLKTQLEKPIGYTAAPLDARFSTVRLRESNYGNFVCDIMRLYYSADCALIAAGTIRGDQVYAPGVIKLKDIMNCFPFEDPVVVLRVTGSDLLAALENSVSTYPAQEGRFPQVSNIRMSFDPAAPPGKRVTDVRVNGHALDKTAKYVLATRDYMARGKDGFASLLYAENGGPAETLVSEENGILISTLLRQYFTSLKVISAIHSLQRDHAQAAVAEHTHLSARDAMSTHWAKVHTTLHESHPLKHPSRSATPVALSAQRSPSGVVEHAAAVSTENTASDASTSSQVAHAAPTPEDRQRHVARSTLRHWRRVARIHRHPECAHDEEHEIGLEFGWTRGIAPRVEGRIVVLGEK